MCPLGKNDIFSDEKGDKATTNTTIHSELSRNSQSKVSECFIFEVNACLMSNINFIFKRKYIF